MSHLSREEKEAFISELYSMLIDVSTPTLIGGDLNLIRCSRDKSNCVINHKWGDNFNGWIEILRLL